MKLVQILENSRGIEEFKKNLNNLKNYDLTIKELREIDEKIRSLQREEVLDIYIAIGNWYCASNSHEKWRKLKSILIQDEKTSSATRDYLAILD